MAATYTHNSFAAAKAAAKKNPGCVFTHDAGNGFRGECVVIFGSRVTCSVVSPDGFRII